jgi:hypothetical protein
MVGHLGHELNTNVAVGQDGQLSEFLVGSCESVAVTGCSVEDCKLELRSSPPTTWLARNGECFCNIHFGKA